MIRIAVIGAGAHSSRYHGPALRHVAEESPGAVELAAVCDLDVAKADHYAREFGFGAVYDEYDAMLEGESPDGLVVITPVAMTREVVADLLPRGIPLLFEKPPGVNSEEARELLAAAEGHDAPHMISFNRRFSPAVMKARQWLAANAADRPPELAIARMFRVDRRDEDFVTSTAIHAADTILAFMGRPT
ncbi:MAG: Gfo/Idh/MocA family oxidoreductase, partial [Phycisphaerae bacterium]